MAANDLSNLVNTVLAQSVEVLRSRVSLARLVANEPIGQRAVAEQGDTINIPIHQTKSASAVTASATPFAPSGTTPTKAAISLDQHEQSHFYMTDKEMGEVYQNEDYISKESSECAEALARKINEYLYGFLDDVPATSIPGGVYNAVGTAGTTPFSANSDLMNDATALLNNHNAPISNRYAIFGYAAAANFKSITAMQDISASGDPGIVQDGLIGRKFGYDILEDGQIPYFDSSGAAYTMTFQASSASNLLVFNNSPDTTQSFAIGDIISISGNLQTFMVASALTTFSNVSGSLHVVPAVDDYITDNIASGTAMTHSADQFINIALHRSAFAFANRPLGGVIDNPGHIISEMTDPVTGFSIRLEVTRQYKQTLWMFDMLYGGMLVRPELCCRIMG